LHLSGNGTLGTGGISISGGELDLGAKSLTNTISGFTGGVLSNGTLTADGGNFNVSAGTITAVLAGSNGLVKSGNGTLVLSGSNSYSGATTVNAGTLNAAHANALGSNATVNVHGGSLLVTADGALSGKNITLASTNNSTAGLAFSGNYNGSLGLLTLQADSIIDLGQNSVVAHFSAIAGLNNYVLKIYNWSGTTLWNGGNGNNPDQIYFGSGTSGNLDRISFYSDFGNDFLGSGYQIMGGEFANQVIPVPEPETWATAILLLVAGLWWTWRKRQSTDKQGATDARSPLSP
jgi:autotransporter-associated beta strand protein